MKAQQLALTSKLMMDVDGSSLQQQPIANDLTAATLSSGDDLMPLNIVRVDDSTGVVEDLQSRHLKGCNCKKSNCLKRYCECFLANIQCSTLCKCVGCKNCDETTKALIQMANANDFKRQQSANSLNGFNLNNINFGQNNAYSTSISNNNNFSQIKSVPTNMMKTFNSIGNNSSIWRANSGLNNQSKFSDPNSDLLNNNNNNRQQTFPDYKNFK